MPWYRSSHVIFNKTTCARSTLLFEQVYNTQCHRSPNDNSKSAVLFVHTVSMVSRILKQIWNSFYLLFLHLASSLCAKNHADTVPSYHTLFKGFSSKEHCILCKCTKAEVYILLIVSEACCRASRRYGFFSVPCSSPAFVAGRNRQGRSFRNNGGPKLERIHRDTRPSVVRNDRRVCSHTMDTKQQITMHSHAIVPKWPSRSSHHTGHISVRYNL